MEDLINRLEILAEPSRELDAEITLAIYTWLKDCPRDDRPDQPGWMTKDGRCYASRYTESIDDALTVLPKGLLITFTMGSGGVASVARVRTGSVLSPDTKEWEGYSKTPAIAIMVAILRAINDMRAVESMKAAE